MSNEKPNEVPRTGHIYDGIEELDHPVPGWFQGIFYVTILFGVGYFFYYELGDGPLQSREYERARMAEEIALHERQARSGGPKQLSEAELVAFVKDPERKKSGAAVYQGRCASCHGAQGQGGIGPNLTDDYWLHGAKMTEILTTISKGVLDKGMPPWESMLKPEEVHAVTAYVRSLLGTRPPDAKAPQGVLVKLE